MGVGWNQEISIFPYTNRPPTYLAWEWDQEANVQKAFLQYLAWEWDRERVAAGGTTSCRPAGGLGPEHLSWLKLQK